MLITWALLQTRKRIARWTQTITAIFGTGLILSLLAIPAYVLIGDSTSGTLNLMQSMGLLMLLTLMCWNIVIMAHIYRNALELHFAWSVLIAVGSLWVILGLTSVLLPVEAA